MSSPPHIVAITGASGVIYGLTLLRFMAQHHYPCHLLLTDAACATIREETGVSLEGSRKKKIQGVAAFLGKGWEKWVTLEELDDWSSPLASGSYRTAPMVVIPCSMSSLSAICIGASNNLLERRADVMLKEKMGLLLVPRETPVSSIHLSHMLTLSRMGAQVIPAMPGFYHSPRSVEDLIHFVVGKVLDSLGIQHTLFKRWKQ